MRSMLKTAVLVMALATGAAAPAQDGSSSESPPVARPMRPERPATAAVSATDCATPATRDRLLADPEAVIAEAARYGTALNAYSDQLMRWRGEQLTRTGRWSRDDELAFGMRILENPDFSRELEAGFRLAHEVVEPMMKVGDDSRPAEERCLALVAAQRVFDRVTASVEIQWAIIDRLFAAEAQRLGVTVE